MSQPILFVGLGGAGGKTLRSIKRRLSERLEDAGCSVNVTDVFNFLHIDIVSDGVGFPAPMLEPDETLVLSKPGKTYEDYLSELVSKFPSESELNDSLGGWVPLNGSPGDRASARVILLSQLESVNSQIKASVSRLRNVSVSALLEVALAGVTGVSGVTADLEPRVLIFSSMCGGTGSGLYQDVLDLLLSNFNSEGRVDPISFLFTNELFDELQGARAGHHDSNLLAFLDELSQDGLQIHEGRGDFLFKSLDIDRTLHSHQKSNLPKFLMGAKNAAGVSFTWNSGAPYSIFSSFGKQIADICLSPAVAERMFYHLPYGAYHRVRERSALRPDGSTAGRHGSIALGSFLTFGYSQLSVGFDNLSRYLVDALTKSQVQTLLWPQFAPLRPDDNRTAEDLVAEAVQYKWPEFLVRVGLEEISSHQITDAINLAQDPELPLKFAASVLDVSSADTKPISISESAMKSWANFETHYPKYESVMNEQVKNSIANWSHAVQDRVMDELALVVGDLGLKVAAESLRKLTDELRWLVDDHLSAELAKKAKVLEIFTPTWWNDRATSAFEGKRQVKSDQLVNNEMLVSTLTSWCRLKQELFQYTMLKTVLAEFDSEFLKPLAVSLEISRAQLSEEVYKGTAYRELPDWDSGVPDAYAPDVHNEVLLDPVHFKESYLTFASEDLPQGNALDIWSRSVEGALLGLPLQYFVADNLHEYRQKLLALSVKWRPKFLGEEQSSGTGASFVLPHSLYDLKQKNKNWLADIQTAFGRALQSSIKSYVSDSNHEVRAYRENVFVQKFQTVLHKAYPSCSLRQRALELVMGLDGLGIPGKSIHFPNHLPFGPKDNICQPLIEVLQRHGLEIDSPNFSAQWFDPAANPIILNTLTCRPAALPHYIFQTLTDSIVRLNNSSQANFDLRSARNRPLTECIPLSSSVKKSLMTGWIVALAFGLIDIDLATPRSPAVSIWNPTLREEKGFSEFKYVRLQDRGTGSFSILPNVLAGVNVAFAEYGSTGSDKSLEAYEFLLFIGREVTTDSREDAWPMGYGQELPTGEIVRSKFLSDWIKGDEVNPFDLPPEIPYPMSDAPNSRIGRKEFLSHYLKTIHTDFTQIMNNLESLAWSEKPAIWEIGEGLLQSIEALEKFVRDFPDEDDPSYLELLR